jgi:(2Fe-2S) ferredoxin
MKRLNTAGELEELRASILRQRKPEKLSISICGGTGCHAYRSEAVAEALRNEVERQGLSEQVELKVTGCHGFCERGPLVVLHPRKIFYQRVRPEDADEIIAETVMQGNLDSLVERPV